MKTRTKVLGAAVAIGAAVLMMSTTRGRARYRRGASSPSSPRPPSTTHGAVVCPAEIGFPPANTTTINPGDYVALRLANNAGTFTELVWSIVLDKGPGAKTHKLPGPVSSRSMVVRLTGNIGSAQVKMPATEEHGFDVGDKLLVTDDCAWEVFHTTPDGMALCGLFFDDVSDTAPPASAADVVAGDQVALYLAPVKIGTTLTPAAGWDVATKVWAVVLRTSRAKSILQVSLAETPPAMPGLGLGLGDNLDITRDCVAGVRPVGS